MTPELRDDIRECAEYVRAVGANPQVEQAARRVRDWCDEPPVMSGRKYIFFAAGVSAGVLLATFGWWLNALVIRSIAGG